MQQNPIEKCESSIDLVEQGLASNTEVMQALSFVQKLGEVYRALRYRFDQAAICHIEKHGEIEDGEKRYYVGTKTTKKCLSVPETVRTILETQGPDALVRVLSTSCFKDAAAMKLLGDDAPKHFETRVEKDLATGKPVKKFKTAMPQEIQVGTSEESED